MKKLLFITENEKQTILEMHGFINKPNVINEQYVELRKVFANSLTKDLVKGLEKSNSKKFDELSKILGRSTDETLLSAFNRTLTTAIRTEGREGGAQVFKFCRELSLINDQFAEEFMLQQIEVINKIRQSPKYSEKWETLVKINYGEKVLEKYKKHNMGAVKPVEKTPTSPKPAEQKPTEPKPSEKPVEQKPTEPKPSEQVKPQSGIPKGNFTVRKLNDGSKIAKFMDAFFSKVFYEGNEKRMDAFSMDVIKRFTPETRSYLLQLLDIVKRKNLTSGLEQGFKSDFNRLPKTVDEEIQMLSGNFWAGYGRTGGLQGILDEAPIPSSDVFQNLLNVTMSPSQKEQLMEYGYKIDVFKK
jgi:hypothetical protein